MQMNHNYFSPTYTIFAQHIQVLKDGTLTLNEITIKDTVGDYMCVAQNSAGSDRKSFFVRAVINVTLLREKFSTDTRQMQILPLSNSTMLTKHAFTKFSRGNMQRSNATYFSILKSDKYLLFTKLPLSEIKTRQNFMSSATIGLYNINTLQNTFNSNKFLTVEKVQVNQYKNRPHRAKMKVLNESKRSNNSGTKLQTVSFYLWFYGLFTIVH